MEVWLPKKPCFEQRRRWLGRKRGCVFFLGDHEHNVDNLAVEVVGQNWSSEVVSLSLFLEEWVLGRMALSCHRAIDFPC